MRFVLDVIRALFRIIGVLLVLGTYTAIYLLGYSITAGQGKASWPLGRVWFEDDLLQPYLGAPSIPLVKAFFEQKLGLPMLWDPVTVMVLKWPTWLALGSFAIVSVIVSMIIFAVTKRKKRTPAPRYF